ncbi:MAG TPA: class I poly(R)-hydroxyalkanoic acid synthase [Rhodocyclaceae bacterium]|nr:class I poly(R)-hydroxyalkanoic acid synthase [Rhodocyclaceae bacterium]HMY50003.1 class I poly(R)-hydroxyalkanoic acid synthase [Rhodocyclaceae bacterium]HMZ76374.1 class I poly(R)-hydroxyalkanoic acid synthase [Rhodocyclaceae bacterium]HNC79127.1 class I poly(R)-hydroxyalkanoic acid synthase [Rhodocyclaceae bacterium]
MTPEQATEALQGMFKFGQSLAQNYFDFLGKQSSAMQQAAPVGAPVPAVPLPEAQELARLQQELAESHARLWSTLAQTRPGEKAEAVAHPEPGDRRFSAPEWTSSPIFDYIRQSYLLNSSFLNKVADALPVADGRAKARMQFLTRQYIDALAPSNFAATNPEFIQTALDTHGESITRGIKNLIGDLEKGRISMTDDAAFEIGRNLATTPGSVIYENELMQLIQYAPLTEQVYQRPLLIIPPCINKFYIMDLQPANSLVRFVVEQGFTVFLVSWRNAKAEQAHHTWDDYLEKGPITALQVVREITQVDKPNVLGFCVGGTLLSSSLAVLRGRGEDPAESLTLMTTLLDFGDAGELGCLVDETSVAAREAAIGKGGLLMGRELAQVFSSLRANDLIWQYVVGNYLKGKTPEAFDLLYWNSDSTNLPGPFLAWYLRNMYLENNLRVPGKLEMLGVKVDLGKVDLPAYLLATREDHIVPWTSAYLVRQILGGETTFVLGASGHIAGAINPASKNRRSYWTSESAAAVPEEWLAAATERKGSWWLHWIEWLKTRSGEQIAARVKPGTKKYKVIEAAPGRYVKEKV